MGLLVAIGVGLAVLLLVYSRIHRAKTQRDIPACGQCGYCVRGIPSLICPECGSDLREVGILVPFRLPNPRLRAFTHILIWTLLALPPGIYLCDRFSTYFAPMISRGAIVSRINCSASYFQRGFNVIVEGEQRGWGKVQSPAMQRMMLTTQSNGSRVIYALSVDLVTGKCFMTGATNDQFSAEAIGQWLARNGIDPNQDPRISDQINDLYTIVTALAKSDRATLQRFKAPPPSRQSYVSVNRDGRAYRVPASSPAISPTTAPAMTVLFGSSVNVVTQYTGWTRFVIIAIPTLLWAIGVRLIISRARRWPAAVPVGA